MAEATSVLVATAPPRWRPGERLEHLIADRARAFVSAGRPHHPALAFDGHVLSYPDLLHRAHQLARWLRRRGVLPGERIGHFFDKTEEAYVSLLAILEAGAVLVPLDEATPEERLRFMAEDAELAAVLTMSTLAERLTGIDVPAWSVDAVAPEVEREPATSPRFSPGELDDDAVAYVIYTSGTTGRPKGVEVRHGSICNFVRVAADAYGYRPEDRVYQGMTLAFDFSFEEVLVPLHAGATVVPAPRGLLLGEELHAFLHAQRVSALCCVPALLASISDDLPHLRLIMLGGEATPSDLVARWDRPGRLLLNTYGPTEATITATAGVLAAGRAVTIGTPLPTYSIAILDLDGDVDVARGERGEIGIAGIGLAVGYLHRDEETRQRFVPDTLALPHNPSGRIYRTGDLGRLTEDGEIEFLGRVDAQVKLRGHRIELTEVESVVMEYEGIAQAAAHVVDTSPDARELVTYVTRSPDAPALDAGELFRFLARRLPRAMIPSYVEELDALPMLPSHKVDRRALPPPKGPRLMATSSEVVAPTDEVEALLVELLQETLGVPTLSTDAHFFDDLGVSSLPLAHFAGRLREREPTWSLSIRDCYLHPSIGELAAVVRERDHEAPQRRGGAKTVPSRAAYVATGLLQLAAGTVGTFASFAVLVEGARWIIEGYGSSSFYLRALLYGVGLVALSLTASIVAKWALVGRFEEGALPLWSSSYLRFWIVRSLVNLNPLAATKGTPLFNLYLRLLGADVSLSAVIEAETVPICTDLLTVGPNTVLRKGVQLTGYKVADNQLRMAPITIGADVFVGDGSVVDIGVRIGDGVEVGYASTVHEGRSLEGGRTYHGCPAEVTDTRYQRLGREGSVVLRGIVYGLLFFLPAALALPAVLYLFVEVVGGERWVPSVVGYAERLVATPASVLPSYLSFTAALYGLSIATAVATSLAWPRLCALFLEPGRSYRLYGAHHFLFRVAQRVSNAPFLNTLFGDSSAITAYLTALGYDLHRIVQTGSNFGTYQEHDLPSLCDIGTEAMVSDGLSMINLELSATSFRLAPSSVPESCFVGNDVRIPPDARLGRNCLLGTKALVPLDGPLREDVGLLGSPSFEIPRIVDQDVALLAELEPAHRAEALPRKNRSNLVTALMFLGSFWLYGSVALALTVHAIFAYTAGAWGAWLGIVYLGLVFTVAHFALTERLASRHLDDLPGKHFSTYDPRFWGVERYWKLSSTPLPNLFPGTPLRGTILRLLGVRCGAMLFDDGAIITERPFVTLGDRCNLNARACLQSHSLEDGAFKCESIVVGDDCNLGPSVFVHYGVHVGNGVTIEADSFVMKGERPAAGTVWRGNPAQPR